MINFVIALPAEAKPLIDFYQLKPAPEKGLFPTWRREDISLVVSGIGTRSSAAATAYLYARGGERRDGIWCNVGVAGHPDRNIGEAAIAHRITERRTGKSWYPPQTINHRVAADALITVDVPETDYDTVSLYDMEAAGFYTMACRCTTAELAQCYKVVSDNRYEPASRLSPRKATELIGDNLPRLDTLLESLRQLSRELRELHAEPAAITQFTERWHFTVTQRHRLRRLLQRWDVLTRNELLWPAELEELKRGQQVLDALQQRIDALPVCLPAGPAK